MITRVEQHTSEAELAGVDEGIRISSSEDQRNNKIGENREEASLHSR